MVDARKERIGERGAIDLARAAHRVIVAKGKSVVTFDMRKAPPKDAELAAALMGPSGNLRAPTLRVGNTLMVGFSDAAYDQLFAG